MCILPAFMTQPDAPLGPTLTNQRCLQRLSAELGAFLNALDDHTLSCVIEDCPGTIRKSTCDIRRSFQSNPILSSCGNGHSTITDHEESDEGIFTEMHIVGRKEVRIYYNYCVEMIERTGRMSVVVLMAGRPEMRSCG